MNIKHICPVLQSYDAAWWVPQVWSTATSAARSGREGGAAARLHSALIAVLTHLISRVGIAAVSDAQVCVIQPTRLPSSLFLSTCTGLG